jgi:5'-nucleotidase
MAARNVMPQGPDLVLSGVNRGRNAAEDVLYSGTIAAAKEACVLGIPAFALSQGFTLEDVKQLLGHSSIVLTSNTYGHVLEQRQRQVAMGMDAVLGG